MLVALLVPLGLAILAYALIMFRAAVRNRALPTAEAIALGAVTNFFDTLGIEATIGVAAAGVAAGFAVLLATERRQAAI